MEKKDKQKEYEKLGRMLVDISDHGLRPGKGYYKVTFLRGIIGGFGGVVGATILVALLLWLLQLFETIPLIGSFVETIKNTINTK